MLGRLKTTSPQTLRGKMTKPEILIKEVKKYGHPQANPPQRKSRARVAKVRTGCKTCKIRHLKCDEAKPICHRCRKDQVKCDGYDQQQGDQSVCRAKPMLNLDQLILCPPVVTSGQAPNLEHLFLHHAMLYTIQDLEDSVLNTSFWTEHLPQSGLQAEGIRHALIALGAAHRDFLLRRDKIAVRTQSDNERFIILHYNLAIRHIQPLMSRPTIANIQTTLMCCLLFICFENIRGRYSQAIEHLRSGARLLASIKSSDPNHLASSCLQAYTAPKMVVGYPAAGTAPLQDDMDPITTLFSCLGIDVSIMMEDEVVSLSRLSRNAIGVIARETVDVDKPFPCLSAARKDLLELEIAHDIFFEQLFQTSAETCKPLPTIIRPEDLQPDRAPPDFSEKDKYEYREIYRRFYRWSGRFDEFVNNYNFEAASPKERCDVYRLRLCQKTWVAILDEEPWLTAMDTSFKPGILESIVAETELIIETMGPVTRPLFTCNADIVPCLALVGCFTMDVDLLQRVIIALKQLNRREGVWDSQDLAEIFEAVVLARGKLGIPVKVDFMGGVLSMAKMLRSLDLPCISATNSIVPLAQTFG